MLLNTISNIEIELEQPENGNKSTIRYEDSTFNTGSISAGENYSLKLIAVGTWAVSVLLKDEEKLVSTIKTETGGSMSITKCYRRKKYYFKKSQNLKLRFSLFNKNSEDLLTIIPSVNWEKKSYDFVLQINEEFDKECNPFLILQAIHCALCCLSMMTGGKVPALVSI
ncbi:MAG: hypothetical protein ACKVOM_04570 [Ferruginibacter sp.]